VPEAPVIPGTGKASVDAAAFGEPLAERLLHEVVRAELAAIRQGSASTKTRGQVRGGGVKPWRQKGTGRARAGSIRSPIWTGGGVTFGPQPRHYTIKVNRKARRKALRSALSSHAGAGTLALLDSEKFSEPSTADAADALDEAGTTLPALVVLAADEETVWKSFRNLARVTVTTVENVTVADIVRARRLVVSRPALPELQRRALGADREDAAAKHDGEPAASPSNPEPGA
jgi:large subunit ribosomal protein L4